MTLPLRLSRYLPPISFSLPKTREKLRGLFCAGLNCATNTPLRKYFSVRLTHYKWKWIVSLVLNSSINKYGWYWNTWKWPWNMFYCCYRHNHCGECIKAPHTLDSVAEDSWLNRAPSSDFFHCGSSLSLELTMSNSRLIKHIVMVKDKLL